MNSTVSALLNSTSGKATAWVPNSQLAIPCRKMPMPSVETTQPMLPDMRRMGRTPTSSTIHRMKAVTSNETPTARNTLTPAPTMTAVSMAPAMRTDPCPKLSTRVVQNVRFRPSPIRA
ncbi:Uncharacterised protein [Bordetella pertussis]|nr:Uncharacterised protein [Bordetella pertussis]CPN01101.1 Uncharacterised protein [Bordetella pertussis]